MGRDGLSCGSAQPPEAGAAEAEAAEAAVVAEAEAEEEQAASVHVRASAASMWKQNRKTCVPNKTGR